MGAMHSSSKLVGNGSFVNDAPTTVNRTLDTVCVVLIISTVGAASRPKAKFVNRNPATKHAATLKTLQRCSGGTCNALRPPDADTAPAPMPQMDAVTNCVKDSANGAHVCINTVLDVMMAIDAVLNHMTHSATTTWALFMRLQIVRE